MKILISVFVLFGLAIAGYFYLFSSKNNADRPQAGAPIVDIKLAQLNTIQAEGKTIFDINCSACHGENARGKVNFGPPLIHKIYEPNHHGDGAFYLAAQNGVRSHHWPFGNMPPIPTVDAEDVEKIISYIRALQRANGIN